MNSDLYELTKGLKQLNSVPRKEAEFHVAKQVSIKTKWGYEEQNQSLYINIGRVKKAQSIILRS